MSIKAVENSMFDISTYTPFLVTDEISKEVARYHKSFTQYNCTGLFSLAGLSEKLGVEKIYVKDESTRFNLNAFKVLGAAYSVGRVLSRMLEEPISDLPFETMRQMVKEKLGNITLAATTDGNHGRGVAWMGRQLGLDVVIYMPKGTTDIRYNNILKEGASATITDMNYDDTVRFVIEKAKENNWVIIQDTAWEGYEDVPMWIMQGYSTIARELFDQLGDDVPTHIFLQAGVGAFAGIMAEAFYNHYGSTCPRISVIEADNAACFYQSALEKKEIAITGDLKTIMAGLACGEPNPIANKVLSKLAHSFVSVPDWVAADGMRLLANPVKEDRHLVSGESGAVSAGLINALMTIPEYTEVRDLLGLDKNSRIMTFSTEGDTDPSVYREVVCFGRYSRWDEEKQK